MSGSLYEVIAGVIFNKGDFAQLSDGVNQNPSVTTPVDVTLTTNDLILGTAISHSTSVNPEEITVNKNGIYIVALQPQVGKTMGATPIIFDLFLQKDVGLDLLI